MSGSFLTKDGQKKVELGPGCKLVFLINTDVIEPPLVSLLSKEGEKLLWKDGDDKLMFSKNSKMDAVNLLPDIALLIAETHRLTVNYDKKSSRPDKIVFTFCEK